MRNEKGQMFAHLALLLFASSDRVEDHFIPSITVAPSGMAKNESGSVGLNAT